MDPFKVKAIRVIVNITIYDGVYWRLMPYWNVLGISIEDWGRGWGRGGGRIGTSPDTV